MLLTVKPLLMLDRLVDCFICASTYCEHTYYQGEQVEFHGSAVASHSGIRRFFPDKG